MTMKLWKRLALLVALCGIIALAWFANSMVGNPLSKYLALKSAEQYLQEQHSGQDLFIERVAYSFKDGSYHVFLASPSSVDSHFSLVIDQLGRYRYDTYDSVTEKHNTASRLSMEYRTLVDTIFEDPSFPYGTDICYGSLEIYPLEAMEDPNVTDIPAYALVQDDLILDKIYDIRQLGAAAGKLIVYVEDSSVSYDTAAAIMLDIKQRLDEAGIPFRFINFILQYPRSEEGNRPEGEIRCREFLSADIYEEGLAERIRKSDEETKAYYNELDK